jgi:hypothetical protein
MKLLFENKCLKQLFVSIIFIDWSCRESFHSLDYLNNQTISRDRYEIIWIEYYSRCASEIEARLKECERSSKPPAVDKWIVMEMPDNVYYHKHLMYNIGIIASKGEIVTICDSDAIFRPTFVESIIREFEEDRNIVLHIDEVRNMDKKYYPFNYPAIEEVMSEGCINLVNGKPRGLVDMSDPIHLPNYGACMSALREDLINIGGADEHIDYLGRICGPYDMTFRLINAGKREVWHQEEFLYHTWHPNAEGRDDYLSGPHDGRCMSQTALSVRRRGRILPLVENPVIRALGHKKDISHYDLLSIVLSEVNLKEWVIEDDKYSDVRHSFGSTTINMRERGRDNRTIDMTNLVRNPMVILKLKIFVRHLHIKIPLIKEAIRWFLGIGIKKGTTGSVGMSVNSVIQQTTGIRDLIRLSFNFLRYLLWWPEYVIDRCRQCLYDLTTIGVHEVAVFGTGDVAQVLNILSKAMPIKITAIYDSPLKKMKFMGYKVFPLEAIKSYQGKVIIASLGDVVEKIEILKKIGIKDNMIVDLW